MCNINVVYKENGIGTNELALLNVITTKSFETNDDAEGAVHIKQNEIKFKKSNEKIIYDKEFEKSELIIAHQRFATSGEKNEENAHPITKKHIIVIHNGVLQIEGQEGRSDTNEFAEEINKEIEKGKDFLEAFKEKIKEINGSKSILVINPANGKKYYYKNKITDFYFTKEDKENRFFASTSLDNLKLIQKYYTEDIKIYMPIDGMLYEIEGKEWKQIEKIEEIEKEIINDWKETDDFNNGYKGYPYNENYFSRGEGELSRWELKIIEDDLKAYLNYLGVFEIVKRGKNYHARIKKENSHNTKLEILATNKKEYRNTIVYEIPEDELYQEVYQ